MEQDRWRPMILWTLLAFIGVGVLMAVAMSLYSPPWMDGTWMWMMPLGMAAMALLVLLVVLLVISVVQSQPHSGSEDPMRALEGRYARGEISRDDFLQMREDLMKR